MHPTGGGTVSNLPTYRHKHTGHHREWISHSSSQSFPQRVIFASHFLFPLPLPPSLSLPSLLALPARPSVRSANSLSSIAALAENALDFLNLSNLLAMKSSKQARNYSTVQVQSTGKGTLTLALVTLLARIITANTKEVFQVNQPDQTAHKTHKWKSVTINSKDVLKEDSDHSFEEGAGY